MADNIFEESLQEELKSIFLEGKWVITDEVPRVCTLLLQKVGQIIQILQNEKEVISFASEVVQLPGTKIPQKGSRIRGSITLNGTKVQQGELYCVLKNAFGKKVLNYGARVSDSEQGLPLIPDIQNSLNYLKFTHKLLTDLTNRFDIITERVQKSNEYSIQNAKIQQQLVKDIRFSIDEISRCLTLAKKELEGPRELDFPTTISHFNMSNSKLDRDYAFDPPPPSEVTIQVSIVDSKLKIASYLLNICNSKPPAVHSQKLLIGHCYKLNNNQWVQVVDHVETFSNVMFIDETIDSIYSAFSQCIGLRDKLISID